MENLFNASSLGGIKQAFVDPCFKCQLRNECNDVEKFLKFEQSIVRQITDAKLFYDIDVSTMVKDIVESHKDKLVCENFKDDETIADKWSTYGILKLQKK